MDMTLYALLKKYVQDSIEGAGGIKGAPCQILSITRNQEDNANIVTFKWENGSGVPQTSEMTVPDGAVGPQGPKGDDGADGSVVTVTPTLSTGTKIAEIDVDGTTEEIFAPSGGSGGSNEIENVATLRQTNLNIGDVVHTLGYRTVNDKGGATYQIRANSGSEVDNAGDIIVLTNGLIAEMVPENRVSMKAFGVIPSNPADTSVQATNSTRLQNALKYADYRRVVLVIPSGSYYFSAAISITKLEGAVVEGDGKAELHYLGDGDFITINSMLDVIFRNVYFYSPNASGALLKILKGSTATTRNKLENCQFYGGFYGIDINSVNYMYIDKCNVLGESTSRDAVDSAAINITNCEYIYITCTTAEKYNNGIVINGSQFIYITECDIPNFKGLWDSTNEVLTGGFGVKIFSDANVSIGSNTIYINNNSFLRTIRMIGVLTLTNKKLSRIFAHENYYMTADCNWSDKGSVLYLDASNAQIQTVDVLDTYISDYSGRTRPTYTYKTVTGGNCYNINVSDSNDAIPSTFDGTGVKNYTSTSKLRSRVPNDFQVTENTSLAADVATFANGELVINGGNWFYPFVYMNFSVACAITSVYSGSTGQELYFKARKPFSVVPSGNFCKNLNSTLTVKTSETLKLRKIGLSDAWVAEIVDKDIPSADLPWVTPQDYGAKGDGVTDDTTAIQAAFDAVRVNGGTVYFPKGTYIVSSQILVYGNTTVFADKGQAIIKAIDSWDAYTALIKVGGSQPGSNVVFDGLIFRGTETFGSAQGGLSILDFWSITNVSVTNCTFQNNMYAAIRLINNTSNVRVFSCRFEACDMGIATLGHVAVSDVTVRNCLFTGVSSLNDFKNANSEQVGIFTDSDGGISYRWVIEDCVFEYKGTNVIAFNVHNAPNDDTILIKDCVVRNCTFRYCLGGVLVFHSENVLLDGLFFDDTPNVETSPFGFLPYRLFHIDRSNHVTIRNVTNDSKQIRLPLRVEHSSDVLIADVDTYVDADTSGDTLPFAVIKNTARLIAKDFNFKPISSERVRASIQITGLTDSYIDVQGDAKNGSEVQLYTSDISALSGNTFVIDNDNTIVRNFSGASYTTVDTNTYMFIGNTPYVKNSITQINRFLVYRRWDIRIDSQSSYNSSLEVANFVLLNDGAELLLEFKSTSYTAGKTFTFNKTGNIIPIDKPFTFSNDYKVVCHFVQKNAKWVEVERTLEYYEGADVDANANVAFIRDKNLLQLPDGDFSINNVNLSIKDNIITLNTTNATTDRIFIKLTNGIALNEGSAPTSWRSETVNFMEAGKTYGIRDFSFGGTVNDTGMVASVRDSSGTSILSRSRTNPVQISASPAYIQLYIESNSSFVDYKVGVAITENEIPQDWGDIVACKDYWKQYISQCFLDTVNFINIGPVTGYVTQGMCTDGTYLYTCLVDSGSDSSNTYVYKYNLADGTLVASVNSYSLGHCNSMTCIPGGYIACVALDNAGTVHIINSSDLSYATSFTVDLSDVYSAYTGIGAISYNASRDVFVCLIRGSRRGYAVLDHNLNLLDLVWTRNFYVDPVTRTAVIYGSCFADDNFIYQVTYNYNGVQVFTYNGDYVGNIILPSAMYANELEDIIIDGENVYINIQQSNAPHIAKLAIHDKRYACVLKR